MARFSIAMLVCSDLGRSRSFYRDVIGLKLVADRAPHWVEQLGFAVEDVDAFVAGCVARGVPVFQEPYDESFGRIAVIGDPDGYPVQVGTLGG